MRAKRGFQIRRATPVLIAALAIGAGPLGLGSRILGGVTTAASVSDPQRQPRISGLESRRTPSPLGANALSLCPSRREDMWSEQQ